MIRPNSYDFDLFLSVLSTFDIGGSIQFENAMPPLNGLDQDAKQLQCDGILLTEDYKKACEKVMQEISDQPSRKS